MSLSAYCGASPHKARGRGDPVQRGPLCTLWVSLSRMAENGQTPIREGMSVGHRDTEGTERTVDRGQTTEGRRAGGRGERVDGARTTAALVDLPFCAIYNAFSPIGSARHK